ncbi:putative receptor protein kinase ZmPK1 [Glycine soja]|uniref:Putative receptor protein kinase ZmPK1 n=1 Tax=Glycine soja TaxID=3848 RepID=A0A445FU54_GLYSO|nr:putative receptor protein kinase ZmPK1 [Glycine soja]
MQPHLKVPTSEVVILTDPVPTPLPSPPKSPRSTPQPSSTEVAVGDVTGCGGIIRDHEGHMVVAFANNLGRHGRYLRHSHKKPHKTIALDLNFAIVAFSISLFLLVLLLSFKCSSSLLSLNKGSFLSVEKHAEDVIVSQNQMFCAGFSQVRENAFSFDIWFNESHTHNNSNTVVWIANREQPVNGKLSKISLLNSGKVVLVNAGQIITWSSNTAPHAPVELHLQDDGNLTNLSSGFYKLLFDDDNVLRPVYDGSDVSSTYWPHPWLRSWEAGRFNYNSSRVAVLDSLGNFNSSDSYAFSTDDHGRVMPRRLTLDSDALVIMILKSKEDAPVYQGVEFYGYDRNYVANSTYMNCVNSSLKDCNCKGFQYRDDGDEGYSCYTKILLLNGRRSQRFKGTIYLRLPKNKNFSKEESVSADDHVCSVKLPRDNVRKPANRFEIFFP